MSLTGFSMNTKVTVEKDAVTIHKFCGVAAKYHIAIGIGWTKQREGLAENQYSIIDRNGNVISDYAKIHPFSYAGISPNGEILDELEGKQGIV